ERRDAHPRMVRNRRIDMDHVDVLVLEHRLEVLVTDFHAEIIPDVVEFLLVTLTNGVTIRMGMFLPKRDEFCAETKAYNCDINLFCAHADVHCRQSFRGR